MGDWHLSNSPHPHCSLSISHWDYCNRKGMYIETTSQISALESFTSSLKMQIPGTQSNSNLWNVPDICIFNSLSRWFLCTLKLKCLRSHPWMGAVFCSEGRGSWSEAGMTWCSQQVLSLSEEMESGGPLQRITAFRCHNYFSEFLLGT